MQHKQVLGIDLLRFLAAASVCAFHLGFYQLVNPGAGGLTPSPLRDLLPLTGPWTRCGWVGVEVFFVISGYVIAFSTEGRDRASYVQSRFLRLWPTVWICATLCAAILLATHQYTTLLKLAAHWIGSMVISPVGPWIDGVYWTLPIEIGFYALVLLFAAGRSPERLTQLGAWLGGASVALWAIFAALQLTPALSALRGPVTAVFYYRPLDIIPVHHGVFFALGIFLHRAPSRRITWLLVPLMVLAACVEIAGQAQKTSVEFGYMPATPVVLVFLGALGLMVAAIRWNNAIHSALPPRAVRAIKTVGNLTYPFYLLHDVVAASAMIAAARLGLGLWGILSVGVCAALAVSFTVSAWLEPAWRERCRIAYRWLAVRIAASPLPYCLPANRATHSGRASG